MSGGELDIDEVGSEALGAWFLGSRAENEDLLQRVMASAVAAHAAARRSTYEGDAPWIDDDVRRSAPFQAAVTLLEERLTALSGRLRASIPFYSSRYHGHMNWDVSLPAVVGYFTAMLHNQNNVAAEASPVTMTLEELVAADLAHMIGYAPDTFWGHLTCDGSVANIEAMWAARNLKAFPHAVAEAIRREASLSEARGMAVSMANGRTKPLLEMTPWERSNIRADDALALPGRMEDEHHIDPAEVKRIFDHALPVVGLTAFVTGAGAGGGLDRLAVLAPGTCHYSLSKAASLLGLGTGALVKVAVDADARMSIDDLRERLEVCLARQQPVAAVVAVLGSTAESAVDPLAGVLQVRDELRQKGLDFVVHADAAWGGYFASLLVPAHESTLAEQLLRRAGGPGQDVAGGPGQNVVGGSGQDVAGGSDPLTDPAAAAGLLADVPALLANRVSLVGDDIDVRQARLFTPSLTMSAYVEDQYRALHLADSITMDPHKSGYVPYPAGALCYRNGRTRALVAFDAAIVHHGAERDLGTYGIEGSKPGAAAAAVWLTHNVIRPDRGGYGRLLGRCLFNSKRLYTALLALPSEDDPFIVVPLQRLPAERAGRPPDEVDAERERVRRLGAMTSNEELWDHLRHDPDDARLFRELGADQLILGYAFNLRRSGVVNTEAEAANRLNRAIFDRLSITTEPAPGEEAVRPPLLLTHARLDVTGHGPALVGSFMQRLGLAGAPGSPIDFLVSTTMDPFLTDLSGPVPNMIPELMTALRLVVEEAVTDQLEQEARRWS